MLASMIDKAMSKYAESFTTSLEAMRASNKSISAELAEVKKSKDDLKKEFSDTLSKVGQDLEDIVKSESSTARKPQEFKAQTRAEKAAAMGAIIRANKLN